MSTTIPMERRENNALQVNSYPALEADISITTHGSNVYWAVCAVMTVSTIIFIGLAATQPRQHRIFHYITAAITMVAAIAYFTMGSNLGWTAITVEFERPNDDEVRGQTREIFYVRYIDWFITTPLLLMDLLLTAGMPWPSILYTILVDEIMIVTGLVGALVYTSYKWGYFAFGCAALLFIGYVLCWEARRHALALGKDIGRVFLTCGSLTTLLWILYPIAWGVCEGANLIAPDSEAAFYAVLDVLAKPVFGALLVWGHRGIDPARMGLYIHDYDEKDAIHNGRKPSEQDNDYGLPADGNGNNNNNASASV